MNNTFKPTITSNSSKFIKRFEKMAVGSRDDILNLSQVVGNYDLPVPYRIRAAEILIDIARRLIGEGKYSAAETILLHAEQIENEKVIFSCIDLFVEIGTPSAAMRIGNWILLGTPLIKDAALDAMFRCGLNFLDKNDINNASYAFQHALMAEGRSHQKKVLEVLKQNGGAAAAAILHTALSSHHPVSPEIISAIGEIAHWSSVEPLINEILKIELKIGDYGRPELYDLFHTALSQVYEKLPSDYNNAKKEVVRYFLGKNISLILLSKENSEYKQEHTWEDIIIMSFSGKKELFNVLEKYVSKNKSMFIKLVAAKGMFILAEKLVENKKYKDAAECYLSLFKYCSAASSIKFKRNLAEIPEDDIAVKIIQRICQITDKSVLDSVSVLLRASKQDLRYYAAHESIRLARALRGNGDIDSALRVYEMIFLNAKQYANIIIKDLSEYREKQAVEVILKMMDFLGDAEWEYALQVLGEIGSISALPKLIEVVKDQLNPAPKHIIEEARNSIEMIYEQNKNELSRMERCALEWHLFQSEHRLLVKGINHPEAYVRCAAFELSEKYPEVWLKSMNEIAALRPEYLKYAASIALISRAERLLLNSKRGKAYAIFNDILELGEGYQKRNAINKMYSLWDQKTAIFLVQFLNRKNENYMAASDLSSLHIILEELLKLLEQEKANISRFPGIFSLLDAIFEKADNRSREILLGKIAQYKTKELISILLRGAGWMVNTERYAKLGELEELLVNYPDTRVIEFLIFTAEYFSGIDKSKTQSFNKFHAIDIESDENLYRISMKNLRHIFNQSGALLNPGDRILLGWYLGEYNSEAVQKSRINTTIPSLAMLFEGYEGELTEENMSIIENYCKDFTDNFHMWYIAELSLCAFASRLLDTGKIQEAVTLYKKLYGSSFKKIQYLMIQKLSNFPHTASIKILSDYINNGDEINKEKAIHGLLSCARRCRLNGMIELAEKAFIKILPLEDKNCRIIALNELRACGGKESVNAIIYESPNFDKSNLLLAVEVLGYMGYGSATTFLIDINKAYKFKDDEIAMAAERSLGQIWGEESIPQKDYKKIIPLVSRTELRPTNNELEISQ
ncbi:MAG: hypothetical protein ABII27_00750 [bacterium]